MRVRWGNLSKYNSVSNFLFEFVQPTFRFWLTLTLEVQVAPSKINWRTYLEKKKSDQGGFLGVGVGIDKSNCTGVANSLRKSANELRNERNGMKNRGKKEKNARKRKDPWV
jgi:hypothetical protein